MQRLRSQDGFTLIELIVASTLMIIVLVATLTVFDGFITNSQRSRDQNAAQDKARNAIDRVARDLRNQATPTKELPIAILKATPQDVSFLTVGALKPAGSANARNLERARYCLNNDTKTLWFQRQTWTTAAPLAAPSVDAPCPAEPASGWQTKDPIVDHVANDTRPIFAFDPASGWVTTGDIRSIDTTLFIDADPARAPREQRLNTTVRLRNQNRAPGAEFEASLLGSRHVLLVAGAFDADGHSQTYNWYVDDVKITSCTGPVCDFGPDDTPAATSGSHTFKLEVEDPSGLVSVPMERTVTLT